MFQCHAEAHLQQIRFVMGTLWQIDAIGTSREQARAAINAAFDELERLDEALSDYRDDSEIGRINREGGREPVPVSEETLQLLALSKGYTALTDGAFDVTVRPLVALWGFKDRRFRVPSPAEIARARQLVSSDLMQLDVAGRTVRLAREGAALDLGAIGKGYAVDRAIEILRRAGLVAAFVDAGGTVAVFDRRGLSWKIGIEDPEREGELVGWVALRDQAVATSGNYLNRFLVDGQAYGHILDPRSGVPVAEAISASVVAERAVDADALATALCVMGPAAGMALLRSLEGIEGLMVVGVGSSRQMVMSEGLVGRVGLAQRDSLLP